MTADQMQVGIPYIVTKPSRHREFQPGDRIRLCADGTIENVQAAGWMDAADVPAATKGMECEIDAATIERRRQKLQAELDAMVAA